MKVLIVSKKNIDHSKGDIVTLQKILDKNKFEYQSIGYDDIEEFYNLIHKENLDSFKGHSKFYNSSFESLLGNKIVNNQFDNDFVEVKDKWSKEIIGELNNRLNYLMDDDNDYFYEDEEYGLDDSYYEYDENEYLYDKFFGKKHGEESDDKGHGEFLDDNKLYFYKTKGSLNFFGDVFYIDSLSILDMLEFINSEKEDENKIDVINPKNHIKYLINSLTDKRNSKYMLSFHESNDENEGVINKIHKIINGSISSENIVDTYRYSRSNIQQEAKDFKYLVVEKETDVEVITKHIGSGNTASGIKQIGIIQMLILNNKLKNDSFLIIDEPEVNLHPEWQFKFAEILVMLVKELNITIYLNSHSPMFIEAIDAFTEFYDMQKDVNYYLSEFDDGDKYNFTKIESDELYKIYDNLGDAYDLIDQLRLEKHLGEKNGKLNQ